MTWLVQLTLGNGFSVDLYKRAIFNKAFILSLTGIWSISSFMISQVSVSPSSKSVAAVWALVQNTQPFRCETMVAISSLSPCDRYCRLEVSAALNLEWVEPFLGYILISQ
jgi:hypothetical protein